MENVLDNRLLVDGADWCLTGWNKNQWKLKYSMELGWELLPLVPAIPAEVPGAVQRDLIAAGRIPDPNVGLRSLDIEWVNNRDWMLEKKFAVPPDWLGDRCELVFDGLDEKGEIYLNGERIVEFEGMFTPVRIDVSSKLRREAENTLQVIFVPGGEVDGQIGYSNEIGKLKSRFNYGWDWTPRIVPIGIWRSVYLHTWSGLRIRDFYPDAELSDDLKTGTIRLHTEAEVYRKGSYECEYEVMDDKGRTVCREKRVFELVGGTVSFEHSVQLNSVKLWWPNGCGDQPVYRTRLVVRDAQGLTCDGAEKSCGFRTVTFTRNEGSPADALPYTLSVNGRAIFMKGINWVPASPFYGAVAAVDYGLMLGRFRHMNVNLLRVWGGGITEKEAFYDYCDRNGLLVWQEFLQSSSGFSNSPPDNRAFLAQLKQVAEDTIIEKRHHPSLVVWCGGNELMGSSYRPVDAGHANIALLSRLVQRLDPKRQFYPTSASGPSFTEVESNFGKGLHHDVHGPWVYLGDGKHYDFYNRTDALLRTESGTPGISRLERLEALSDCWQPWPPTGSNPYWLHRGAFWIQWEQLGELFGRWEEDTDEMQAYTQASRFLQMESLRYLAESSRRREPQCSGVIVWMGNEPFANNANTSLIEYDGMPKPAYFALRQAFGPRHVSAEYAKLGFRTGELFKAGLYVHIEDEQDQAADGLRVRAKLLAADGRMLDDRVHEVAEAGERAMRVGMIEWLVEPVPEQLIVLRLELEASDGRVLCANTYLFTVDAAAPLEPLRRLPEANIRVLNGDVPGQLVVENLSDVLAVGVMAIEKMPSRPAELDNNYLILLAHERATISDARCVATPGDFYFEGFNIQIR